MFGNHNDDEDLKGAASVAAQNGGGEHSLFAEILNQVAQHRSALADEAIDQNDAVESHKKFYGEAQDSGEATDRSLGSAAAMQALKMFTGGGSSSTTATATATATAESAGPSQFIGLAMSEASKLFDSQASQGKVASGTDKQAVIQQAAQMAFKMYLQSKGSGSSGATGSSGGLGGLLSMASKYLV